ncbi:MAG: UDP-3-O-acylglucosamine N-acyltransferase 2 [Candidatus Kapaibacterium sp.]|nr:MAG: UDP-3-O-acylglucosamine N-acyltransferase 2 [Candidatus Kapabacteria bacterium]
MNVRFQLSEIASLVGGRVEGDAAFFVTGIAPLDQATPSDLSFVARREFLDLATRTHAGAVITTEEFAGHLPATVHRIIHPAPEHALATILEQIVASEKYHGGTVHHTASIAPSSTIAKSAQIAAGVVIGEHATIGENVEIGMNAVIEDGVVIGDGTVIGAGAIICRLCVIGNNCRIGEGAVIGSEGFGYVATAEGGYRRLPHIGNVVVEDDVEIGANTCIDRALLGSTIIRRGAKLDNLVHIAHNVTIGQQTAIAAQAGIAGSTHIGERNRIGGQAGLTGHIQTCNDVTIGAQAGVSKSITEPGEYSGTPAVELKRRLRSEAALRRLVELLPILESLTQKFAPTPTDQLRDEHD